MKEGGGAGTDRTLAGATTGRPRRRRLKRGRPQRILDADPETTMMISLSRVFYPCLISLVLLHRSAGEGQRRGQRGAQWRHGHQRRRSFYRSRPYNHFTGVILTISPPPPRAPYCPLSIYMCVFLYTLPVNLSWDSPSETDFFRMEPEEFDKFLNIFQLFCLCLWRGRRFLPDSFWE